MNVKLSITLWRYARNALADIVSSAAKMQPLWWFFYSWVEIELLFSLETSYRWIDGLWPSSFSQIIFSFLIISHANSIQKQRSPGAVDICEFIFFIVKTVKADWDTILVSLFNAVNVDKALVLLLLALDHLLGENVQVTQLELCVKLIIRTGFIELRGLMDNDLANLVDEDTLLGRKESHRRSYL